MTDLHSPHLGPIDVATPLSHGQSRRILSSCLRYFAERGSTRDDVVTLGWHGPHEPTVQRPARPCSTPPRRRA